MTPTEPFDGAVGDTCQDDGSVKLAAASQSIVRTQPGCGAGVEPEIVSQRLGHSDVAITFSIHSHVTEADDRRATEQAAAAIFAP